MMFRDAVVSGDGDVRDVVDRLVDHSALRHDRRDLVGEAIEANERVRLRNLDRLTGKHRHLAGESARPIERRAGRDDHESRMRDEHAAARPVVLVGEAPLVPPKSARASASPRAQRDAASRSRTAAASPSVSNAAWSGILSIFTGRSGGSRAGSRV